MREYRVVSYKDEWVIHVYENGAFKFQVDVTFPTKEMAKIVAQFGEIEFDRGRVFGLMCKK